MKVTIVPIVISAFGTVTKGLLKGLEDLEVGWREETNDKWQHYWERPEYWGESRNLRRFAVTQTPVKNHKITLMWKALKE